jgi:endonuclease/exonuclease/phosphatase family metal-dependent hydrolase
VAVVVELTAPTLAPMSRAYPFASARPDAPDEVVYSRWPIVDVRSLPGDLEGFGVRAIIERPEGRFVVYGIHTFRPWIDDSRASISVPEHRRLIRELADQAAAERLPTVVAGDLNLVDRSSGYRLFDDRMRDAVRTSWAGPTSLKGKFLPLLARIDHIFVSEEWCADGGGRFDIAGSDHRGVVATVGPCGTGDQR